MRRIFVAAVVSITCTTLVFAQTAPPPPPPPPPAAKAKPKKATTAPQTPEGIECSKQADAKGLHGQERVRFRANCKKKLMKQKS
jgi:hypothetical protein